MSLSKDGRPNLRTSIDHTSAQHQADLARILERRGKMIAIEVRSKDDFESQIRQFAERRIGFALDHLRDLRRLAISIEDVNGPKGGADKHCRIAAEFAFASIVVEETQTEWQTAVARAIHRLGRKATQELQRVNRTGVHSAHRARSRTSRIMSAAGDDGKVSRQLDCDGDGPDRAGLNQELR